MIRVRPFLACAVALALAAGLRADPLSKSQHIDFFRDTNSRHLHGMAARSDGRLLTGPAVDRLKVDLGGDLLWCMAADGDGLLVGTGPDGKVLAIDPNVRGEIKPRVVLDLPESHVFAVRRLPNGDLLAGTSPQGTIVLARDGKVLARAALPADSILDFLVLPATGPTPPAVLVATGNPGRIYRVDVDRFAASGVDSPTRLDAPALAAHGITLWGSVRDDNLRCLLRRPDGTVVAGSAPSGNLYAFPADGGAPDVLAENRNAEVTDLLPWDGGFFAALTFASDPGETRVKRAKGAKGDKDGDDAPETDTASIVLSDALQSGRFRGRSQLVWFPDGGFPEVVAARNNTAFYRLQRHGDLVLVTGGEEGELLGYDPANRRSLTFAGAASSQLNAIVPAARIPGAYYVMGNNPSALILVNFPGMTQPTVETERIDLGVPARIGALRFTRPLDFADSDLRIDLRASMSSDPAEGWGDWRRAEASAGGWSVAGLRGRYLQVRISPQRTPFELAPAEVYFLPQDRRPQLVDFRVLSPNFALIPSPDRVDSPSTTLAQLLQSGGKSVKDRSAFLASQVVPQHGTQVVFWTINDPDDDNIVSTFSLRREGERDWTDLAVDTTDSYCQFEISHLPEGLYHTRLVAHEAAPRPEAERLATTFETDDFIIDRTPPEILEAKAERAGHRLRVTVRGRDALSLLAGAEVNLNNGAKTSLEQPADGILDGREETFVAELPMGTTAGATSVEVILYDAEGNSAARRLPLAAE